MTKTYQIRLFLVIDGHNAVSECVDSAFSGGLSSDYTSQHGLYNAHELSGSTSLNTKCSTISTVPLE